MVIPSLHTTPLSLPLSLRPLILVASRPSPTSIPTEPPEVAFKNPHLMHRHRKGRTKKLDGPKKLDGKTRKDPYDCSKHGGHEELLYYTEHSIQITHTVHSVTLYTLSPNLTTMVNSPALEHTSVRTNHQVHRMLCTTHLTRHCSDFQSCHVNSTCASMKIDIADYLPKTTVLYCTERSCCIC